MTMKSAHGGSILVTGAAGDIGAIGRHLTAMLLAKGHKVRALVRREDERAESLRQLGAEIVQGDLTDLASMHRAIEGCARIYFGMSVSAAYLEATVNVAAVARHHGVQAFVNMSQMTVTQMSITETTGSPQHKLHWLAEQALAWSGLPVVTVRPTVFLEGFFLRLAAAGVRDNDELALPLGNSKTSPVSSVDVARAVSVILDDPASHIGHIYNLTGFEVGRSGPLRARLFRGSRPNDPLSQRAALRVDGQPSRVGGANAPRQPPRDDGGTSHAGAV